MNGCKRLMLTSKVRVIGVLGLRFIVTLKLKFIIPISYEIFLEYQYLTEAKTIQRFNKIFSLNFSLFYFRSIYFDI